MPFESQEVMIVRLSDEERISGAMTPESLAKAIAGMHRDGLVVLENAADVAHVDQLNGILAPEAEILAKLPTTHFNNNSINGKPTGNMSQAPPMTPDLMYDDIWANPAAVEVISALLGPKPRVNYVNGNTALGGFNGARQRVHADFSSPHATYPFAIVANIYLSDVSPANGSTELWLGSHRNTTFVDHRNYLHPELDFGIREDLLVERQKYAPPIQPVVKRGSVVLRDLRLWHAGLANPTRDPRMMLAFVHTPAWYLCPGKVVLPEDAREKVESWASRKDNPVQYQAHYVPDNLDHKEVKFAPNFKSANEGYMSMLPAPPRPSKLTNGYANETEATAATKVAT